MAKKLKKTERRDFEQTPGRAASVTEEAQRREFLKLSAEEQCRALRGAKVERVFTVERDGIDTEKRTAWMSIASEEPYARWWGVEILDVGPGSVRLDRLKSGAPLLVGHDHSDQVGVVEKYEMTPDRKLRVLARFSRSARAEEIWQDVLDGIRRNTSVGYVIHELALEKQEEELSTYRVTDWEPYEGSLVAVPADPTVGVGRASDDDPPIGARPSKLNINEVKDMNEEEKKAAAEKAQREAAEIQRAEQTRIQNLVKAGEEFKDHGGREAALELISDPNATVETLRSRLADKLKAAKPTPTATAQPGEQRPAFGTAGRQVILRGGKLRAFTQPLCFTDGTSMDPLECAYRSGMWLMASVYGNEKARRWCAERGIDTEQRVMQTGVGTLGGVLVPVEMEQSIIDLRESYGLARRLARRRPMMSDTKSVPRRTGGITAYFIDEDNAGVTASDKGWDNVNLVAKTLAALALISKNLEEDSMIDVVDDLAMELAYAFAKKEDQCWLIGDGTSTYGGMQGLLTKFNATAYASRFNAASGHDTMPEYDASDLAGVRALVADLPIFPGASRITSKAFFEAVFNRLKATAGGNTAQTRVPGGPQYDSLGDPAYTSEILASDPTADQSDTTVALYGDYTNSSSFGDRRGIMVEVLRERYAEKLQIGVLGHERFQIVNHDLGSTTVKGPVGALYAD